MLISQLDTNPNLFSPLIFFFTSYGLLYFDL